MLGKSDSVPKGLQKAFLVAVSATFLLQFLSMVYLAIQQSAYGHNQNFSVLYWYIASQVAVPLIFLGLAYFLGPRRKTMLSRLFESFIMAAIGLFGLQIASMIVVQFQNYLSRSGGSLDFYWWYEIATIVVVLGIYTAALMFLRAKKKWK